MKQYLPTPQELAEWGFPFIVDYRRTTSPQYIAYDAPEGQESQWLLFENGHCYVQTQQGSSGGRLISSKEELLQMFLDRRAAGLPANLK